MKKHLLTATVVAVLLGIGVGFYLWNKPHQNMSRAEADFQLEAAALFTAFETDEAQANSRYLDKIIEVRGTITEVSAEQKTVVLGAETSLFGIRCAWDEFSDAPFPDVQPGQLVTLKGTCSGFLGDVVLSRCVLVE